MMWLWGKRASKPSIFLLRVCVHSNYHSHRYPLPLTYILNGDRGEAWHVNDPRITINASSSTQYHCYFDSPFNTAINHVRGCPPELLYHNRRRRRGLVWMHEYNNNLSQETWCFCINVDVGRRRQVVIFARHNKTRTSGFSNLTQQSRWIYLRLVII